MLLVETLSYLNPLQLGNFLYFQLAKGGISYEVPINLLGPFSVHNDYSFGDGIWPRNPFFPRSEKEGKASLEPGPEKEKGENSISDLSLSGISASEVFSISG